MLGRTPPRISWSLKRQNGLGQESKWLLLIARATALAVVLHAVVPVALAHLAVHLVVNTDIRQMCIVDSTH